MENRVKLYHNPACSKSQAVLARILARGVQPEIVDYLQTSLSEEDLTDLLERLQVNLQTMGALIRTDVPAYAGFARLEKSGSDKEVVAYLLAHPELLNRPIVVTDKGARLCRPIELVDELL